jgi:hypothetical protein
MISRHRELHARLFRVQVSSGRIHACAGHGGGELCNKDAARKRGIVLHLNGERCALCHSERLLPWQARYRQYLCFLC